MTSFIDTFQQDLQERHRQRLERFCQVFGRVNGVLALRPIKVRVENSELNAPAYSNANEVVFNSRLIGELKTERDLLAIYGLDFHEIGHVLFTPRHGSRLVDYVVDNGYWSAFNALEDCRLERLLTGKYPSIAKWLTATVSLHLIENSKSFDTSYLLLRGRRYLPAELRAESRKAYKNQDDIAELCDVVDSYRDLVFPRDYEVAEDLIARFHKLLGGNDSQGQDQDQEQGQGEGQGKRVRITIKDPFGHGERPHEGVDSSTSRPLNQKQQERARDNAPDAGDDEDINDEDDIDIDIDITLDFSDSDNSDDEESSEESDDDSDIDDVDDSDDVDDEDESDDGESSNGQSAGNAEADKTETLLNNIIDELLNNEEVIKEIDNVLRQVSGLPSLSSNGAQEPEIARYKEQPADSTSAGVARSFGRELERLRASVDPAWDRHLSSGKLNAKRAMRGDDHDSIYDQWNQGRTDATDIECVIMLDTSGSMGGVPATQAYRSMYAIKRALDRINASTTVLTFSSYAQTLYSKHEKAGTLIRDAGTGGGTEPTDAIAYATRVFAESDKPTKLLIAITDGVWSGEERAHREAITRMKRAGVLTSLAYITQRQGTLRKEALYGCEIGQVITNPSDLVGLARNLVKTAIARQLTNA